MNFNGRYILDEHGEPVPEPDLLKWAAWMQEPGNRRVAMDEFLFSGTKVKVSTVFLGLDHSFEPGAPPVLWETMVFGGRMDQHMRRYRSRMDAVHGHHEIRDTVRIVEDKKLSEWLADRVNAVTEHVSKN